MNETLRIRERIKADCLRLLTQREHSRQELFQKLTAKAYPAEWVCQVLDQCAEENWQSDQRYAENYVRQRFQKGYGKFRIRYELQQRGINSLDFSMSTEDQSDDEYTRMEQLYQKKYPADRTINRNEWLKRYRFLLQRGFSAELISTLLKRLQLQIK